MNPRPLLIGLTLLLLMNFWLPAAAQDIQPEASGGWTTSVFPGIFVTPETGFGAGGGVIITRRPNPDFPDARQSSISFAAFYTEKKQSLISLAPNLYFNDDKWNLNVEMGYKNFPNSIFGIGNDTPVDSEEDYTLEGGLLAAKILRRSLSDLYVGASYTIEKGNILKKEAGGLLDDEEPAGHHGGIRSGVGVLMTWDGRNHTFYPTDGGLYQLSVTFYRDFLGSDFAYESFLWDLRRYFPIFSSHVLAAQILGMDRRGEVPFYMLPHLGGNLRGIYAGRYQDNAMLMGQLEYRYPIYGKFSGIFYAGGGDVSDGLEDYQISRLKFAGGFGLRYALNDADKINIRFDMGFSEEGSETYISLLEAF